MQERDQRQLMIIIKRDRLPRNIINMRCFQSRRRTRVPLLTTPHKDLRLIWTRQQRHWTIDDLKHVAWPDEFRFQLSRADICVLVWKQSYKSMDPICQKGTVLARRGSVMVMV
ncbi:uncharacterized protein TNCV_2929521 [Trichonephila clavipes]|nr:uncharacterized protein TNCV_2929521 [Trichonephila clavipes]